jgi:hypothetical protein
MKKFTVTGNIWFFLAKTLCELHLKSMFEDIKSIMLYILLLVRERERNNLSNTFCIPVIHNSVVISVVCPVLPWFYVFYGVSPAAG